MLRFRYAAASHTGLVRPHNEDAGYAGGYLLLVADGVGGSAAGEVASASTAYVTSTVSMISDDDPLAVLAQAVSYSQQHLSDGVDLEPMRDGMSTTLTAVLCDGDRFALGHIGDSRCYLWRDDTLSQLTKDHTLVQHLLDSGDLTADQAVDFPYRSVIARSIHPRERPTPDLVLLDLRPGDRLLLASDGLTDLISDTAIAAALGGDDLEQQVDQLLQLALDAGGRDNITCVLAEVIVGERIHPRGTLVGAATDPHNLIDGAAIRIERSADRRSARLQSPSATTMPSAS